MELCWHPFKWEGLQLDLSKVWLKITHWHQWDMLCTLHINRGCLRPPWWWKWPSLWHSLFLSLFLVEFIIKTLNSIITSFQIFFSFYLFFWSFVELRCCLVSLLLLRFAIVFIIARVFEKRSESSTVRTKRRKIRSLRTRSFNFNDTILKISWYSFLSHNTRRYMKTKGGLVLSFHLFVRLELFNKALITFQRVTFGLSLLRTTYFSLVMNSKSFEYFTC